VILSVVLFELSDTTAVRWRPELTGSDASPGRHWSTKLSYYQAVESVLARGAVLSWQQIVAEVRPRGSRTTFFAVAGPHAKHPLRRAHRTARNDAGREVAGLLSRPAVPEMLIDEAKVCSCWPHREGWLRALSCVDGVPRSTIVECLVRVVLDWALGHASLAAALNHGPPACAIEDLMAIRDGRVSAAEADGLLREAIRLRLLAGYGVAGVLHRLRPHIRPRLPVAAGNCGLARAIDQLTRDGRAPDDGRRQAVEIMRDAIDQLELREFPERVADAA
jgi:hypothetical protein